MTNRTASALRLCALAGASLALSGCALFSPVQTDYSYIPADGLPLSIPGLELRNVVIVSDAAGGPGTLVGQAVNEGPDAVEVRFEVEGGAAAEATVASYSDDAISMDGAPVVIDTVPEPPGSVVQLMVTTDEAGTNVMDVPVLPSTRYYSGLGPDPSASPTTTP